MHTRFGLAALGLVLAAGCPADDDDAAATTSSDTGTSSMAPSTSAAMVTSTTTPATGVTGDPMTTAPMTSSATESAPTTSGSSGTSTGDPTSGSGSSSTTGGPTACEAGCQVEVECGFCSTKWRDEEACVDWCEANLVKAGEFADFCRTAWSRVHECVGTLSCDEFEDWCAQEPPFKYPCISDDQVLAFECKGQ